MDAKVGLLFAQGLQPFSGVHVSALHALHAGCVGASPHALSGLWRSLPSSLYMLEASH